MAIYSKKWVPPKGASGNFTAWKAVMTDIYVNILEAGLIETANSDLDLDAVTEIPPDNSYAAGTLEFAFNDSLQATHPVLLQMQMGCGAAGNISDSTSSGMGRRHMPRVRWRVSVSGHLSDWVYCPQGGSKSDNSTSSLSTNGWSAITYYPEKGFFGFLHGIGSVGKPFVATTYGRGAYHGANLTCFIQRTLDAFNEPVGDGVAIHGPRQNWIISFNDPSIQRYFDDYKLYPSGTQYISSKYGANGVTTASATRIGTYSAADVIKTQPVVFVSDSSIQSFPFLVHYLVGEIPEEEVFEIQPSNTDEYMPFIALGNETCLATDNARNRSCFAMLFSDDQGAP